MPAAYNGETKIHYEVSGAGPAVLFIPGLGIGIHEMRSLIGPLAQQATVIAVDNRGVGFSDKPDERYSIELMAADAVAVLDAAGIERASVVGYSMGGRIALHLALTHPQRVQRLVLLATGSRITSTRHRRILFAIAPHVPVGPKPRQPAFAFRRQRSASENYDARGRLGEIHAPTLILHGGSDRIAVPALAEELSAGIPSSQLEWYDGGHLSPIVKPTPIAEAIRTFLA